MEAAPDHDDEVQQSWGVKASARADQRRGGGEDGAAVVSRHHDVADVPLAAGRAHLTEEAKIFEK